VDVKRFAPPGTVTFDDVSVDAERPASGLLFHDGNNRSMEQLMSDSAKNAIFHNLMVEMLRKQFGSIESALRERIA
jgi:flagellar basal body rod protein FlgB